MRRIFFLLVVVLWVLPASSQGKRPFTFEDMMALRRVGEPVPSPDGKWVLFSAVDVDLAANTKTPHVWIVPRTVRGGRRMGSGLRFSRPKRTDRRYGSPTLIRQQAR